MMLVDECERIQPATISPASQKGRPNPLGNERTLIIMSAKAYGQTESSFAILLLVRRGLPKRRLVEGAQLAAVQHVRPGDIPPIPPLPTHDCRLHTRSPGTQLHVKATSPPCDLSCSVRHTFRASADAILKYPIAMMQSCTSH